MFMNSKIDLNAATLVPTSPNRDAIGLTGTTLLETPNGWTPTSDLAAGDEVETFDGGLATILRAERFRAAPGSMIHVPGGVFDTCGALSLLPTQRVMVDFACVEDMFDRPCVLVEAQALVGYHGIVRKTAEEAQSLFRLTFQEEELVYANTGAVLHCPGDRPFADDFFLKISDTEAHELMEMVTPSALFGIAA